MADLDEDGDFDFTPSGRSNLSNLFTSQAAAVEDVNQSLMYVPPKQPKKTDAQQLASKSMKLLHAVATHTYKLENGQYESHGVLGSAILANHEASTYKLLLYKGKQQQVTWSSINSNFSFQIDANNYAKFNDDKDEKWSIMFNDEAPLIEFAKQVALAKANSCGKNLSNLIIQELIPGEGPSLENGDSAEINYTGWLLTDNSFGQVFDSKFSSEKPFRLRLGKTKVIKGWHQGLLGAKKGSRRLLIVPPSLGYGDEAVGSLIPPNSVLIFEIYVNKVKHSHETSHSPSPNKLTSEKPEVPSRTHSLSNDESIRMRGASLSEQIGQSPQKDKAKIISRMAKMGMATLPMQGTVPTQATGESELERELIADLQSLHQVKGNISSPIYFPPQAQTYPKEIENDECNVVQNIVTFPRTASPQQQASIPQSPAVQNYQMAQGVQGGSFPFLQQAYPSQSMATVMPQMVTSMTDAQLPLLIAEGRSHSADTRLNLGKISDKIDAVLHKLDDVRSQTNHAHMPYMESAILAHNIDRIVQENIKLKHEMETKSSKIQELNEKICDILQKNQRFFEESNSMLEQRSDSMQMTTAQLHSKLLTLEQEKVQLSSELSEAVSKFNSVQSKLEEHQRLKEEYLIKSQVSETERIQSEEMLVTLKAQHAEKEILLNTIKNNFDEMKQQKEELILRLKKSEEKLETLQKDKSVPQKVNTSEMKKSTYLENVKRLEMKLEEAMMWKKKHEVLLENTLILKRRYEDQIAQLFVQLQQAQSFRLSVDPSQELVAEIKRAMNALYKSMQARIHPNKTYTGAEVLQTSLTLIRSVTLTLLEINQKNIDETNKAIAAECKVMSSGDQAKVVRIVPATEVAVNNVINSDQAVVPTVSSSIVPMVRSSIVPTVRSSIVPTVRSSTVPTVSSETTIPAVEKLPPPQRVESENSSEASFHSCNSEQKLEEESHSVQHHNVNTVDKSLDKEETSTVASTSKVHTNEEEDNQEVPECAEASSAMEKSVESKEHFNNWRPVPPPLFDDDEEEDEDEDDWLK